MKTCKIEGCDGKYRAKGMCNKHYRRWKKGVDPETLSQTDKSPVERFKEKLADPDPVTGCIEWTGATVKGYGTMGIGQKLVLAHRFAYELKHGPIPEGMLVCHHCDNPPCCNDEHLFLGTHADNNLDRALKGRGVHPEGEVHAKAKLKNADIPIIRARVASGGHGIFAQLAREYGVSKTVIYCIRKGRSWKSIP